MATATHLSCRLSHSTAKIVIVISKRVVPLAVRRNRLRRRIREIVRHRVDATSTGVTLYIKKGAFELTFLELADEVDKLLLSCK